MLIMCLELNVLDWWGSSRERRQFRRRWPWDFLPCLQGRRWRNTLWFLSSCLPHELLASAYEEVAWWWLEMPDLCCTFVFLLSV